ncbi:hypothetical protein BT96DRAFT_485982 [Gymnopus androsaceus JB14]|uniref:Secreted protein n=1 Tax=Gymnopus androsaceus JB14 TaxID=1447944 RepID=A0A6A4HYC3_9AGAR|nr:hypothetical protein BT96DRAFT_485982 [Gymnopus androsaceus JB14]
MWHMAIMFLSRMNVLRFTGVSAAKQCQPGFIQHVMCLASSSTSNHFHFRSFFPPLTFIDHLHQRNFIRPSLKGAGLFLLRHHRFFVLNTVASYLNGK